MFKATLRTITELLDSKKAAYSFIAVILACVLHLYFGLLSGGGLPPPAAPAPAAPPAPAPPPAEATT